MDRREEKEGVEEEEEEEIEALLPTLEIGEGNSDATP